MVFLLSAKKLLTFAYIWLASLMSCSKSKGWLNVSSGFLPKIVDTIVNNSTISCLYSGCWMWFNIWQKQTNIIMHCLKKKVNLLLLLEEKMLFRILSYWTKLVVAVWHFLRLVGLEVFSSWRPRHDYRMTQVLCIGILPAGVFVLVLIYENNL